MAIQDSHYTIFYRIQLLHLGNLGIFLCVFFLFFLKTKQQIRRFSGVKKSIPIIGKYHAKSGSKSFQPLCTFAKRLWVWNEAGN